MLILVAVDLVLGQKENGILGMLYSALRSALPLANLKFEGRCLSVLKIAKNERFKL